MWGRAASAAGAGVIDGRDNKPRRSNVEAWILIAIVVAFAAGATFVLSLEGEKPPRLLVEERHRLSELRERAEKIVIDSLQLQDKDLALLKGFFLGVAFGLLAAAKYFGVFR
jgi:hypothetical protein